MHVAVVGGTGVIGAQVVTELSARGDRVRVLTRHPPAAPLTGAEHRRVDLATGEGLAAALEGVEAVVDAANGQRRAREVLVEGTRRLTAAGAQAGVAHHLAISIVGIDAVPIGYYRVKVEQERALAEGEVPWSVLRATQFHTLLASAFAAAARVRLLPSGAIRVQPVDPAVVAVRVADAVHAGPAGRLGDVGGPQVRTLTELAHVWRAHETRRLLAVPVPLPPRLGRPLRAGALCNPDAATSGPTFEQWLQARR